MAGAHPAIRWHQRLDTRVAASLSLVVAMALGTALIATTRAVTMRALATANNELETARSAFEHLVVDRADFASAQAALVTQVPVFRAHLAEPQLASDEATVEAMAEEYRSTMQAEFAIVSGASGRWIASTGWPEDASRAPANAGIAEAIAGRTSRKIAEVDGRLFLIVSAPARFAEEVLGTLTIGFPLDDAVARRLSEETGCRVNFASGGRLVASSFPSAERERLSRLLTDGRLASQERRTNLQWIGDTQYAVGMFRAAPATLGESAGTSADLILLQDWAPTADFIARFRQRLAILGALIFLPALGVAVVFSRRMMRPLGDLVQAAGDIAGGNWDRRIAPSGGAEMQTVANAFNEMTASLQHWYEEARTRDDQFRQAQKMEAIGRLAGGVAHDFNNLLTAIRGYGEMLRDELPEDDEKRLEVLEILKAADRAASLTRQLLTFSRRQAAKSDVFSLGSVLNDMNQLLRRVIGEDVELRSAVALNLGMIRGDARQLEQAIVNLAVNARDAMPAGGVLSLELANVTVGGASGIEHARLQPGSYVRLTVSDTGTGMDAQTAARIFEPFFTTKEVGRGTGLGLAMVYGVVEQAGGLIDLETAPGRGTAFRLYFPRADGEVETAPSTHVSGPIPATLRGSETVLLVEDDQHVNALINRALTQAGYRVIPARNGDEALAVTLPFAEPIDLLLTDVVMPGMNGRELAERVVVSRPETRVVFMSGYSDDAMLRHGLQTETTHFIQKPFSMDALAAKMREALLTPATRH